MSIVRGCQWGEGMSPRSESMRVGGMVVITSNIQHLGAIASEDEFQRERMAERKKERSSSNLHRIYESPESNLGIFIHHLVLFPREGLVLMICMHTSINIPAHVARVRQPK